MYSLKKLLVLLFCTSLWKICIPYSSFYDARSNSVATLAKHHRLRITAHRETDRRDVPHPPKYSSWRKSVSPPIENGSIVEYRNQKGSKQLVLVQEVAKVNTFKVINDAKIEYTIHAASVLYALNGNYTFGDLLRVQEMIEDFRPVLVEKLWEQVSGGSLAVDDWPDRSNGISVAEASQEFFRSSDPVRRFVTEKIMASHGSIYFSLQQQHGQEYSGDDRAVDPHSRDRTDQTSAGRRYFPLPGAVVQDNLRDRAALREFKQRYFRIIAQSTTRVSANTHNSNARDTPQKAPDGPLSVSKESSRSPSSVLTPTGTGSGTGLPGSVLTIPFTPDMPERVASVLNRYSEGLKQIVAQHHPWVTGGTVSFPADKEEHAKGCELLQYLGLAPSPRNARKVLEVMGYWSPYENVEKYIVQIRDKFPVEVLEEARYLMENADNVADPDERLRKDLRHLRCYAIDREGASEVDDAISIELVTTTSDNGNDNDNDNDTNPSAHASAGKSAVVEKLWVHIADVSKWIRPGSELSLEAERRMSSLYMPDERICMFPEQLSVDLLSLSAREEAFALSCGVTLDEDGQVTSYEVCPSKIRLTRRLTYQQLDEVLRTHGGAMEDSDTPRGAVDSSSSSGSANSKVGAAKRGLKVRASNTQRSRASSTSSAGTAVPPLTSAEVEDLVALNRWALVRHTYRTRRGALDRYLRHRTELQLFVRKERETGTASGSSTSSGGGSKIPFFGVGQQQQLLQQDRTVSVSGVMTWSNSSSVCTVTEFMILMCDTIGSMCSRMPSAGGGGGSSSSSDVGAVDAATDASRSASVWYKVQRTEPPLDPQTLSRYEGQTPLLRAALVIQHLRSAVDSKQPGAHCTSSSTAYVQCTSPIRRYHDLYNHYCLKAAMHAASLGAGWKDRAREEAGILMLEGMATAEQRLQKLNNIKLVSPSICYDVINYHPYRYNANSLQSLYMFRFVV